MAKPTRRRFSAEYRLRILEEADRCTQPGEIGRLLRREGLYSSHLSVWRKARRNGSLKALAPKKRGAKPAESNPLSGKVRQLEYQRVRDGPMSSTSELRLLPIREVVKKIGCSRSQVYRLMRTAAAGSAMPTPLPAQTRKSLGLAAKIVHWCNIRAGRARWAAQADLL